MESFVRFILWARKQLRPQSSRPGRFAPIVLERLEERCITAVVAGREWAGAFSPGSAFGATAGRTAPMSGAGEAIRETESLPFTVSDAHAGGRGPAAQSSLAPLPRADGFASFRPHDDSIAHLDALFAGTWQLHEGASGGLLSGPRFGGVGPHHDSGLNPSPPAPEDPPSPSGSVAGPDATGSEGPGSRANPPDPSSDHPPPLATPSVSAGRSSASLGAAPDAPVDGLRITRSPVANATMEVRYVLTEYSSAGAVRHEGVAAIASGAAHVDIPTRVPQAGGANGPEIVTLTVLDRGDYQVVHPTVALFLPGNARDCSEPALVAAFQEEKLAEAFAALVARNRSSVMQTCYGVLGNWHDAEDVAQMVFLALAQQQMQLQHSLAGWLRTVARNASIAFLRSRARRSRHESRGAKPVMVASEEPLYEAR